MWTCKGFQPDLLGLGLRAALVWGSLGCTEALAAPAPERLREMRLAPKPLLDEVFADTAGQMRRVDRFIELTSQMRRVCDDFGRAVQESLAELGHKTQERCNTGVVRPYQRAQALGQEYLRIGRELTRHHEQVRDAARLGDTVSLTPDYRDKAQRVLRAYDELLVDYREMKATFHEHLGEELRFAGCDPDKLQAQVKVDKLPEDREPKVGPSLSAVTRKPEVMPATPASEPTPISFYVDNTRCKKSHQIILDGRHLGEVQALSRGAFQTTVGPHELCLIGQGDLPGTRVAALNTQMPVSEGTKAVPYPCNPGTLRRGYFHDGWTIALRCE